MRKTRTLLTVTAFTLLFITAILVLNSGSLCTQLGKAASNSVPQIAVPDDYPTIADAIGNATPSTTIYVKKGTYEITANPLFINKTLTLIGEDQANTILVTPPDTRIGFELFASKIGLRVCADNFSISNFTITNCDFGVYVTGNGTKVCNITSNSLSVAGSYCHISGNVLADPGANPLNIVGSYNNISSNNFLAANIYGKYNCVTANHDGSIGVTGNSNVISDNFNLIYLDIANSNSNLLYNNTCAEIDVRGSNNNTICGNIVQGGHTVWGVLLGSGSGNVFYANNITGYDGISGANGHHYGYGVAVGGFENIAENNMFYCNNFMLNYKHVSANWEVLGAGNSWDNGSLGNYWGDYSGYDHNTDGIGDVSYTINGLSGNTNGEQFSHVFGIDHHPLMKPVDISKISGIPLETASIVDNSEASPEHTEQQSTTTDTQSTERPLPANKPASTPEVTTEQSQPSTFYQQPTHSSSDILLVVAVVSASIAIVIVIVVYSKVPH